MLHSVNLYCAVAKDCFIKPVRFEAVQTSEYPMQLSCKGSAPKQLGCTQSLLYFLGKQITFSSYVKREKLCYVNLPSQDTSLTQTSSSNYSGRYRPVIVILLKSKPPPSL